MNKAAIVSQSCSRRTGLITTLILLPAATDFTEEGFAARHTSFEGFRDFFDQLNAIDSIPISLTRWEMTGLDDDVLGLGDN